MHFDILTTPAMRRRPTELMESFYHGALKVGVDARMMRSYAPRAGAALMLYGLGGNDRLPFARKHMAQGGRLVSWDAGYWDRKTEDRKYRVSIDGFHCPQRIMRGESPGPARWLSSGLKITSQGHPGGNVILVGNGPKSGAVGAAGWSAQKSIELRRMFPKLPVVYRPKRYHCEPDVIHIGTAMQLNIEKVLDKASLVVCRHSNVAIDACRMGIPVVCEDGAAAAIYPSRLEDAHAQPSEAIRLEFLHRLAWWQWSAGEAECGDPWPWLMSQLQGDV